MGRSRVSTAESPVVLVLAHGSLAGALVETAAMIAGDEPDVVPISLAAGERPEVLAGRITEALDRYPGRSALLLVDLFGGSPATAAAQLLGQYPALQVVTGVNLPMLLETLLNRERGDTQSLAALATQGGEQGIVNVRERLSDQGLLR